MRITVAVAVAWFSIAGLSIASESEAAIKHYDLNIPRQSLDAALKEFAQQTGLQIARFSDTIDGGGMVGPIEGNFSVEDALATLLTPGGLTYQLVNERTIAVLSTGASSNSATPAAGSDSSRTPSAPQAFSNPETPDIGTAKKTGFWDRFRLAQNEPSRQTDSFFSKEEIRPQSSDKNSENRIIDEVVVTGTHIRDLENATVPMTVLDRPYIESTGITTTSALIESLPQNFSLENQSGISVPGTSSSSEQGASINLRGIGEGTTLVLLNGRRMASGFLGHAVDISALPLSAIERVEIITDGASAIYGSDAVGGVVNFILRHDYQGAETVLHRGWADGVDEYHINQLLGDSWASGNAMLSLDYYKRGLLDADSRSFVPSTSGIGSLSPRDKNYSAMFSGRQDVADSVDVFADALYTKRESFNRGGETPVEYSATITNPQLTASAGFDWRVGPRWQIETVGSFASNKLDELLFSTQSGPYNFNSRFEVRSAEVKADGPLFALRGGDVHAALGADWRSESFDFTSSRQEIGDFSRTVRSAFAEVYVPIVGAGNARAGIDRLELSVAGRFDDYSSFGHSFDPKFGLMWAPVPSLRVRGSYGTSYVAPSLNSNFLGNNATFAYANRPDPGAPGGTSEVMQMVGKNPGSLGPQKATSWSFGIELMPAASPDFRLNLNYYSIDYTDRIANPPFNTAVLLGNPSVYGGLIVRNPTVAQVNAAIASGTIGQGFYNFTPGGFEYNPPNFDASSVQVLLDSRERNLSVTKTSGVDLGTSYRVDTAAGRISLGLDVAYIIDLEQQVTETSTPGSTLGTIFNPPRWRGRGSLGWQHHGWMGNVFLNHTASYTDNRQSVTQPVASYTTVDARLAYDFGNGGANGPLSGVMISASAQNLFNRDPPPVAIVDSYRDMGFDPANADPMGRLIGVEISKRW